MLLQSIPDGGEKRESAMSRAEFQLQQLESRICLSLSFAPPVGSAVGPVTEMAVGDFNRDGRADAAVWGGSNASVRILAGSGDGKFMQVAAVFAGTNVSDLEAADLNADGNLDLVAANKNELGTATVLLGDGAFSFKPAGSYFVGGQTQDLAVGDFDGNKIPDIAAANAEMWSPYPWSDMPSRFAAGLLRGLGGGTFARVMVIPLSDAQTHIATGDVDGNGRLDAVFGGPASMMMGPIPQSLIHVVLNRPAIAASVSAYYAVRQFVAFAGDVAGLALADLGADGRGRRDLAAVQKYPTGNGSNATLHTMLSNGDGTFARKAVVNADVFNPAGLSVGDLDRDGLTDFIVTGGDPRPVIAIYPPLGLASILRGTGGGAVAPPQRFYAGPSPVAQSLADLNNDGRLDILAGNVSGVSALLNTTASPPATADPPV
jgi:hypothetical protein